MDVNFDEQVNPADTSGLSTLAMMALEQAAQASIRDLLEKVEQNKPEVMAFMDRLVQFLNGEGAYVYANVYVLISCLAQQVAASSADKPLPDTAELAVRVLAVSRLLRDSVMGYAQEDREKAAAEEK